MTSSQYIDDQRREYSLYVMQMRAIPHIADGLKAGARRIIWTDRDGSKYKCAALAGATMPIHPHAAPDDTINTIAATYGNNIPLVKGKGAFGTLLKPTAYGASRYTSVAISQFTKDVMLKDIEIIPMMDNYDGTLQEPVHFLPLVPVSLLNPQEGIAVGFACKILPRELDIIIKDQIRYLEGYENRIKEATPRMVPLNQSAVEFEGDGSTIKWYFEGEFNKLNATTIQITNLPYGVVHKKFVERLNDLEELTDSIVQEVIDDSTDKYDIKVRFKKGALRKMTDEDILTFLKLKSAVTENLNLVGFDGQSVVSLSYKEIIKQFTEWRLGFYTTRYKRLASLLEKDIQRYLDVILAIKKKVNAVASKTTSRKELKEFLKLIGIVNLDYIADLPIYRFTEEEKKKMENKVKEAKAQLAIYKKLISSKGERTLVYVDELHDILTQYRKGTYT